MKKRLCFVIILPLIFLFFDLPLASCATLTFDNDGGLGNYDWATPINWQTGVIPGPSDTALITANVLNVSSGEASAFIADFSNGSQWGSGLSLSLEDMASFNDTSQNEGTINGNTTFNDTTFNNAGIIKGNATFDTTWYSGTTAPSGGVLTINGSNYWSGKVTGTVYGADFQPITSYVFNDASYNNAGTINGNATFNTTWYSGTTAPLGGVLTVNGGNYWSGDVTGTVYGSDNQAITSYVFNNTSYNQGTIKGNATFNDASYDAGGSISGNATLDTTWYSGTTAPSGGVLTINGGNYWSGGVAGTVYGSDNQAITSYVFNNTSYNQGTINGNATFNDASYDAGGSINGNATFNTTWYSGTTAPSGGVFTISGSNDWLGNITGNVYGGDNQAITSYIFNDTSTNQGTIKGNATFNDTSFNKYGTIDGNATFNDTSFNNGGTINGNATFNTSWYNGTVAPSGGVMTINGANYWSGNVTGTVDGSDNLAITNYVFNDTSYNTGTINGTTTFNDTSYNSSGTINGNTTFNDNSYDAAGTITGNATFNGTSYNKGGSINGNGTFNTTWYSGTTAPSGGVLTINGSNYWSGNVTGTVYGSDNQAITSYVFNNTSYNQGTINGNATFNDTSYDGGGSINGNATFDTTWYSGTTAPSGGVFTINGSNSWLGNITGTIYGSDNQVITSYIFNNSSSNQGPINGNATFNDTSYNNSGTINGNATFNAASYNNFGATINGNATFNGASYNDFGATINGSVVFNSTADQSGTINAGSGTVSGNFSTTYGMILESGTVSSNISGIGDITKTGNGTVILSGTNTYTGLTTISGGTLQIGDNGTTGSVGTGNVIDDTNFAFDFSNSATVANIISGPGTITQNSTGSVTLSGVNTYTGVTVINSGTLAAGVSSQAFGLDSAVTVAIAGTLDLGGYDEAIGSLSGAGTVTNSGATGATLITGENNTSTTFSGDLNDGATHDLGLTKDGTGTLTLSGDNTYSGATTLTDGILELGGSHALGSGTIIFDGGILQYSPSNNIDYSGQFSAAANQAFNIDTNGQNVTFASQLNSSGGVLTKIGLGTLTLTNANSYSGGTFINAGTLQVNNTNALGSGAVTNNATLAIGGTHLSLNGTYAQNSGSALDLTVSAATNGNITTPSASLAGSSKINVTVQGLIPNDVNFDIINAAGAITGAAPEVTSNGYVIFTSAIINNDLVLTAQDSLEAYADNANARALAHDLDNLTKFSSDMSTVLLTLETFSNPQITAALDEMGPIVDEGVRENSSTMLNNLIGTTIGRVHTVLSRDTLINDTLDSEEKTMSHPQPNDLMETGISSGDEGLMNGMWAEPYGSYLNQGTIQGFLGYHAWNTGTVVGMDHVIADNFTLGVAGSYAYGGVRSIVEDANTDITSAQGILYAGYQDPDLHFFLNGSGTMAWNWYKGQRDINFMNRTADASYNGQQYSAYVEGGYTFDVGKNPEYTSYLGENFEFTPLASLQWTHYAVGSYTETNAGALDLNVDSQSSNLLESGLGASMTSAQAHDWGIITPEIHIKWLYDYIADKMVVTSSFVEDGVPFTFYGPNPLQNSVNLGGKLTFDFKNNLSLIAAFDSEIRTRFLGIFGSGTVRYKF